MSTRNFNKKEDIAIANNDNKFVMIPENNSKLWNKNKSFSLLHSYILERVRQMERNGLACYMTNRQFAEETNTSEATVSRAVGLLAKEKVLWVSYHQTSVTNKQRIMRVYDPVLDMHNDRQSEANCTSEIGKITYSDSQNEELVNNSKLEKINSICIDDYLFDFDVEYVSGDCRYAFGEGVEIFQAS